jgi:hypothetical protein
VLPTVLPILPTISGRPSTMIGGRSSTTAATVTSSVTVATVMVNSDYPDDVVSPD